jgi:hypothetical protein
MNHPDVFVNLLGILYGAMLITATFVRTSFTEAMRIDALFVKEYTEKTRPVNLLVGLLVAGYAIYSLLSR